MALTLREIRAPWGAPLDAVTASCSGYRTWAKNDRERAEGAFENDAQHRIERADMREARAARPAAV